jgi:hypothetical protein
MTVPSFGPEPCSAPRRDQERERACVRAPAAGAAACIIGAPETGHGSGRLARTGRDRKGRLRN